MAKRGVLEHPKFARLRVKLGLCKYSTLGILETLWQMAGRYAPQGDIGRYSDEDIEAWIEWQGEPGTLITALVECKWLDIHPGHRLLIHDWRDHVDNTTRTALRRNGLEPFEVVRTNTDCKAMSQRSFDGVEAVLTPPEPEPEPEPEPGDPNGCAATLDAQHQSNDEEQKASSYLRCKRTLACLSENSSQPPDTTPADVKRAMGRRGGGALLDLLEWLDLQKDSPLSSEEIAAELMTFALQNWKGRTTWSAIYGQRADILSRWRSEPL